MFSCSPAPVLYATSIHDCDVVVFVKKQKTTTTKQTNKQKQQEQQQLKSIKVLSITERLQYEQMTSLFSKEVKYRSISIF
jgi:hypothetical protein